MKLPKPRDGLAQYQGLFAAPAFRLFGGASGLSFQEKLFQSLAPYGARIENLKSETGSLPSITYDLTFPHNWFVRVALDRVDMNFYNLINLGDQRARALAQSCWEAIHSCDEGIALAKHTLTVGYQFDLGNEGYKKLVGNYVKIPKELPNDTDSGVVFYIPPTRGEANQGGSIVLDRLAPGTLNMRIVMVADATKLSPAELPSYADNYILGLVTKLGLEVEV
jgi:hypothetical protein